MMKVVVKNIENGDSGCGQGDDYSVASFHELLVEIPPFISSAAPQNLGGDLM